MTQGLKSLRVLWAAGIVVAVIGVALTVHNLTAIRDVSSRFRKRAADRAELQAIRESVERQDRLVAVFAAMPAGSLDFPALTRKCFGKAVTTRELEPASAVPGWTARRVGLAADDVAGDDMGRFLAELSSAKPPWGATELVLRASGKSGRLSRAELTLVSVERSAPR